MSSSPNITFIICTYNRADYLADTLQSLLQTDLSEYNAELLIIDNNSSDQTPQVVDRFAKDGNPIRYIKETNQGLSFARNRGIKEAKASCLVFLDDDIRATKKLVPAWVSFFEKNPQPMAGGGKIHVQFDDPRPKWMSHFLLPLLGHHDLGNSPKRYPKNKYPFGGNMGFRKAIFEQFRNFDTELGRKGKQLKASEEKELFNRLKAKDIDIHYLPEAKLFHRANKQRLTKDYIRRQAVGLGQSIALQVDGNSIEKIKQWVIELTKWAVSIGLILPYTLALQPAKAVMLLKFRKWIAEGYFSSNIS
ncbi:MAG: glycosyltransferase [Bacteroidota bacterium]